MLEDKVRERIHVRLDSLSLERLKKISERSGKTVSEVARDLIVRGLDRLEIDASKLKR